MTPPLSANVYLPLVKPFPPFKPDLERKTAFVECDESSPPITSKAKLAVDRDGERGRKQISSDKAIYRQESAEDAISKQ